MVRQLYLYTKLERAQIRALYTRLQDFITPSVLSFTMFEKVYFWELLSTEVASLLDSNPAATGTTSSIPKATSEEKILMLLRLINDAG